MLKYALIAIAVAAVMYGFSDDQDAMKACQMHHSHSECFYALHR